MRQKGVTEMRPFVGALGGILCHPQDDLVATQCQGFLSLDQTILKE